MFTFQKSLEFEKMLNQSLLTMHEVSSQHNDANMCDFIEGTVNLLILVAI